MSINDLWRDLVDNDIFRKKKKMVQDRKEVITVVVNIDGGLVQEIYHNGDQEIRVIVVDHDVEGASWAEEGGIELVEVRGEEVILEEAFSQREEEYVKEVIEILEEEIGGV